LLEMKKAALVVFGFIPLKGLHRGVHDSFLVVRGDGRGEKLVVADAPCSAECLDVCLLLLAVEETEEHGDVHGEGLEVDHDDEALRERLRYAFERTVDEYCNLAVLQMMEQIWREQVTD
jgi:hypothetical protein